jgi:hypothetical protein
MARERKQWTLEQVNQAIQKIRAYHAEGVESLQQMPEPGKHGDYEIRNQAGELGWNETKLRKARQFAHPKQGYSEEQLEELFALLREHKPSFGTAHIGLLVTVAWPQREDIQKECIENNWNTTTLQEEILKQFGHRQVGGRRRQVSKDVGRALVQLGKMADTWKRWVRVAKDPYALDSPVLNRLPEGVRRWVEAVNEIMPSLGEAVEAALVDSRPKVLRANG